MKIQYCSDLHLEFRENKEYLTHNPLQPVGDILLLAGDVVPFALMKKYAWFFDYVADHFETTYWVPGNHEYYQSDLAERSGAVHEKIRDNVFLVNNVAATHGDVRFVFSTLWSHISPANEWSIQQGLSDFETISYNKQRFTPAHYNEQHQLCLDFIKTELEKKTEKTVVITHHIPTFMHYPEKYRGDVLNEAFAIELFDVIEPCGADYWIYGHHHQHIDEFTIGSTKLINNQLGYVKYGEHKEFNMAASLQL